MPADISCIIVTYNSARYIRRLLDSIAAQTTPPRQVVIVDNASVDETVTIIRQQYAGVTLLENRRNLGFSRAYNQGMQLATGALLLVCNQDVILGPRFLERLMIAAEAHPECGSFGGKVAKFRLDDSTEEGIERLKTLDTAGMVAHRSRGFSERGQDQSDRGQYDRAEYVFGISGALVLYRREALVQVAEGTQYFDEEFFAYKEDVDLAWRLQRAGWQSWYEPSALAWHARGVSRTQVTNPVISAKRIGLHRRRDPFLNMLSYRNQHLVIAKNETWRNLVIDFPWIFGKCLRDGVFYFLFQPGVFWRGILGYVRLRGRIRAKRTLAHARTLVTPRELRCWFGRSRRPLSPTP